MGGKKLANIHVLINLHLPTIYLKLLYVIWITALDWKKNVTLIIHILWLD